MNIRLGLATSGGTGHSRPKQKKEKKRNLRRKEGKGQRRESGWGEIERKRMMGKRNKVREGESKAGEHRSLQAFFPEPLCTRTLFVLGAQEWDFLRQDGHNRLFKILLSSSTCLR